MGDKEDAAFISRTIESLDVAKVREWLVDRQVNCLRHARSKTGADREGWLEDYAHFSAAIGMIDWSALERQDARS
jgi:hypothetical protein